MFVLSTSYRKIYKSRNEAAEFFGLKVTRIFALLQTELEASEKKLKEAQDDLAAVQFTPHSKNGKMLMAKCRTLQEENEEIGREMSEGKVRRDFLQKMVLRNEERGLSRRSGEKPFMSAIYFWHLNWFESGASEPDLRDCFEAVWAT